MGTLALLQSRSSETGVSSPLKTLSLPQLHSDTNQPPQETSHQRGLTRRGVERKEMGPSCSLSFLLRRLGQGQFRWMQRGSQEGGSVPAPPPSAPPWLCGGCLPERSCDVLIAGLTQAGPWTGLELAMERG